MLHSKSVKTKTGLGLLLLSKSYKTKQVSDPDWEDLAYFARLIPRVCHNINRSADGKICGNLLISSGSATYLEAQWNIQ